MFSASLTPTLNERSGEIQGDFLSNNTTHIYIHTGEGSRTRTVEEENQAAGESSRIPVANENDLRFVRSRAYGSDIVVRDGYRIHVARYLGKVVTVKVYQGPNSVQRLEADLEINSYLLHPAILRTVAVCRASRTPFLVLSMESHSMPTIPISLDGFRSLVCYLADALSHSETESLIVGAQVIRDVSSGLDYLGSIEQTFAISRLTFDLLVDENNNICITVGLGEENVTGTQEDRYIDVFHKLCIKNANNECYLDNSETTQRRKHVLESDLSPNEPRREYAFIPDPDHISLSLRRISKDYARFTASYHEEYPTPSTDRRDEVTLGTSVSRTAVISHLTPSLREICQICHQLVEDGIFNCSCGQGDDGMSPTIQCFRCSVWSHRACQIDGGGRRFLCTSCLLLESQSQPESAQIQDIDSALSSSENDMELSSDPQNHDTNQSHGYPVELEASPDSEGLNPSYSEVDSIPTEVLPPVRVQPSARVRLAAARVRPTTRVPPAREYPSGPHYIPRHPVYVDGTIGTELHGNPFYRSDRIRDLSREIEYQSHLVGTELEPIWISTLLFKGVEYGRGQSSVSRTHSRELAAAQALRLLEQQHW
ncbi:hypothetical protein C8J56DRAFT_1102116 [Mycena floridula]|nr:hypothetical protein C8J56DRAFT_1102116 [Mycena floridula]